MANLISLKWFLFTHLAVCAAQDVYVQVSDGHLKGYTDYTSGKRVHVFKGVPFAAPPVGQLRFEMPQRVEPWSGVRDATRYSAACGTMGESGSTNNFFSEDCLYLNIFADSACQRRSCPVISYIHGGGFYFLSAVAFNDSAIIEKYASQGVIVVLPAYRLGVLGFISFGGSPQVTRNLGIHDMIASLSWINREISRFGGDPDRVTLMGHSTGATAVLLLSLSPQVPDHFFNQVISMSSLDFLQEDLNLDMTTSIARDLQCLRSDERPSELTLNCLRSTSLAGLTYAQDMYTSTRYYERMVMCGPEIDNNLFTHDLVFGGRRKNNKRYIIGITRRELLDNRMDTVASSECENSLRVFGFRSQNTVAECAALYATKSHLIMRDQQRASTRRLAAKLSAGAAVYLFSMDLQRRDYHAAYNQFFIGSKPIAHMTEEEAMMNRFYPEVIRNFVRTANPQRGWKPFGTQGLEYLSITADACRSTGNVNAEMKTSFYPEASYLWNDYLSSFENYGSPGRAAGKFVSKSWTSLPGDEEFCRIFIPPVSADS